MRELRAPGDVRQAVLVIGGIGALAIALLLLVAWSFAANGPTFAKAAVPGPSAATAAAAAMVPPRPSTSYVVPTPTFVTPSVIPTGPRAPLLPPELAAPEFPGTNPAPTTPAPSPTPSPTPSPSRSTSPPRVQGVSLDCDAGRRSVKATLRLVSSAPVLVTVSAGGESRTERVSGRATVTVLTPAATPRQTTCSAVVGGQQIGPIPAR